MPNWCDNMLTVEAKEETSSLKQLEEFIKISTNKIVKEDGSIFTSVLSFNNTVPMPEEVAKTMKMPGSGTELPDWYEWSCQNWGCKWDAHRTEIEEKEDRCISYFFRTPWSPPLPWLLTIATLYPNLKFRLEFSSVREYSGVAIACGSIINFLNSDEILRNELKNEKGHALSCHIDDHDLIIKAFLKSHIIQFKKKPHWYKLDDISFEYDFQSEQLKKPAIYDLHKKYRKKSS